MELKIKDTDFSLKNSKWRIFKMKMKIVKILFFSKAFVFLNIKIDKDQHIDVDSLWMGLYHTEMGNILCQMGRNFKEIGLVEKELEEIRKDLKI